MGQVFTENLQEIPEVGGFPVAELGADRARYNGPYVLLKAQLGEFFNLENPNEVLNRDMIKGNATTIELSTDNSGGDIATIPFFNKPNDVVGAFKVPRFKSIFWIENTDDKNNLRLQYSQTTDLDFRKDLNRDLVMWPHVDVATLCKGAPCK